MEAADVVKVVEPSDELVASLADATADGLSHIGDQIYDKPSFISCQIRISGITKKKTNQTTIIALSKTENRTVGEKKESISFIAHQIQTFPKCKLSTPN